MVLNDFHLQNDKKTKKTFTRDIKHLDILDQILFYSFILLYNYFFENPLQG